MTACAACGYEAAGDFKPGQRPQIGDVIPLPEQGSEVEATVAREIDGTELTVRVILRVEERKDFVKEWPIGEMVTVVRGPLNVRASRCVRGLEG